MIPTYMLLRTRDRIVHWWKNFGLSDGHAQACILPGGQLAKGFIFPVMGNAWERMITCDRCRDALHRHIGKVVSPTGIQTCPTESETV